MAKLSFVGAILSVGLLVSSASAQATRTWVSGVGDDANPCSRTAPCKTFAGAISKTAAGGEIDVLDPGGWGAVTITKSITIDAGPFAGGILNAGSTGIIINALTTDTICIRNLSINGAGSGLNGIRILQAANVHIENCEIYNQSGKAIDCEPGNNMRLFVTNTVCRDCTPGATGGGLFIKPSNNSALVFAELIRSRFDKNTFGIRVEHNARVTARECTFNGNNTHGAVCEPVQAFPSVVNLNFCTSSNNNTDGIRAGTANGTIVFGNCQIEGNGAGGAGNGINAPGGGHTKSYQNNMVNNNATDGTPTDLLTFK